MADRGQLVTKMSKVGVNICQLWPSKDQIEAEPVAKRHHEVSASLALLLECYKVSESSRAVAPTGDKVL